MTITHAPDQRPYLVDAQPEQIDLASIDQHRQRFRWLTWLMIGVSFIHMAAALLLFSGDGFFDKASTVGMILGVELLTTFLALYLDYAKRADLAPGCWAWVAFIFALLVSFGLNTSYLWSHRPGPEKIPDLLGKAISVGFGAFIPLCVFVAATIQGRLEDFRTQIERRAAERAIRKSQHEAKRTHVRDVTPAPAPANPPIEQPKAADILPAPRANNEPLNQPTYTLDGLLKAAGLTRANALTNLEQYGITTAEDAYRGLKRFGRLPDGIDEATFRELFNELHTGAANSRSPRTGNGKAEILTTDVPAILARLQECGLREFTNMNDLCEPCGWSSNSSAGKAVRALLQAGSIRQTASGYEVVAVESEVEA